MMTVGVPRPNAGLKQARASRLLSATLAALLLAPAGAWATDIEAGVTAPTAADFAARWSGWGGIGGYYGTDQSSYGVLTLFLPLAQTPDSLVFTQIDGKYFDGDVLEGNLALGYRTMTASGFNLGAWVGADVVKSASDNVFGQVSGGLEALSDHFDARFNGYWPFTGPQTAAGGVPTVILDGANIFMTGGQEIAMYGVDGEVGLRMPFAGNGGHLAVYGGGFWFDHADVPEAIAGPKARVELAFNDILGAGSRLTGEYEYSHDNVRGDRHQVGARLRIPLGPTPPAPAVSGQWLRMTEAIERDTDIVIGGSGAEPVEDAITEVDFDQVIQVDTDGELTAAFAAGANKLIILDDMGSDYAGDKTVGAFQTLQGGGSTIQVRGIESGAVGNFTAPGDRPTIDFDGSGPVLTVADRTHLAGLDITGDPGAGFGNFGVAPSAAGLFAAFTDLDVSGVGGSGFEFSNATNAEVVFRDVWVSDTGSQGIIFANAAGVQAELTNVWVSDTGSGGIFFGNTVGAMAEFNDVWVSDTGTVGISFGNADNAVVDFNHVHLSNVGTTGTAFGMDFLNANGTSAGFSDVTFAGTAGDDDDALIRSTVGATLNGDIADEVTNAHDFCTGDFTGTLFVNGVAMTGDDCVSDRRLKRDVRLLATRADGLKLYAFRYLWSDTDYVGVMAQDLAGDRRFADAAVMTPAGFYVVDYARLGLRMTTLDAWRAQGPTAVSRPRGYEVAGRAG